MTAKSSLPALTEAVKRLTDDGKRSAFDARGKKLAAAHLAMIEQSKTDATVGWDASPITTARMCAEVYAQIKDEDWSVVGTTIRLSWPHRLWDFNKPYQWNGGSGGAGVGYNLPASLGAALANKKHGRFTVAFGGDGDFMFNPGALWTAAHHQIPILYIVQNNRAYHQEYMYLIAMAARHGRDVTKMDIGTTLKDPNIDYATVARGMGAHGEGPITDPKDLAPALTRAIAAVKSRPAGRARRRHRSALRSAFVKTIRQIARIAGAVAMFSAAVSMAARAQDAPPGDAANGKRMYLADGCFTCHGRVGQGGAYNGPAPDPGADRTAIRRLQGTDPQSGQRYAGLLRR